MPDGALELDGKSYRNKTKQTSSINRRSTKLWRMLHTAVELLTLPVRSEPKLEPRCRQLLESRQDLEPVVSPC